MKDHPPAEISLARPIVDQVPLYSDLSASDSDPIPTPGSMGYRGLPDLSNQSLIQGLTLAAARKCLEDKRYQVVVAPSDSLVEGCDSAAVMPTIESFDHALVIAVERVSEDLDRSSLNAQYGGDEWAAHVCAVHVRATLYERGLPDPLWDDVGEGFGGPVLLRRLKTSFPEESRQLAFMRALSESVKNALKTLPKYRPGK